MDLEDAATLVTGASSGIGEATALAFGRDGARVALAARREDRLESVADRVEAAGGEALVVPTDLSEGLGRRRWSRRSRTRSDGWTCW